MKYKILVVDDEKDLAETIKDQIEIFFTEDINVDLAFNGLDGADILNSQKYDLIITDYKMPRMNGAEMIQSIRAEQSAPSYKTPIILITGFVADLKRNESLPADITFLEKPYNIQEFTETIRKNLFYQKVYL
mgnify:CR=1 FL=1|tara:strand:- start:151 stop:546 length:396 start_codon:yes stop_codon:yes gene_type:complete